MDFEKKINDLIWAKNETNKLLTELKAHVDDLAARLSKLEEKPTTLKIENLQVGDFTFIGSGDNQGIWLKMIDGRWHKVHIGV